MTVAMHCWVRQAQERAKQAASRVAGRGGTGMPGVEGVMSYQRERAGGCSAEGGDSWR